MIEGSLFQNVHDTRPNALPPVAFDELVGALVSECYEADPADKTEQTCISPATYGAGATRSKVAARSWNWFAADIDNKLGNQPGSTISAITGIMNGLNAPWLIYTTASSTPQAECFRVMFPVDRPILAAEFGAVWQSFSQLLPMDPQTKDISRLFIVPRQWANRANRIDYRLDGDPVSVDQIVQRFPAPVPPPILPATARPTPATLPLTRGGKSYVQPTLAAPFVPQRAIDEAMAAAPGGRMYRFLLRVAFRALHMGYEITSCDLEAIGHELATWMGRGHSDIRRDASSAHRYARQQYVEDRADQSARLRAALAPKRFRGIN